MPTFSPCGRDGQARAPGHATEAIALNATTGCQIEVRLPHPINPHTYQIKTNHGDRNGPQPKEGPYADLAKGAIGLLILGRPFVNAPSVLIFDPNLVSLFRWSSAISNARL